MRLIGGFMFPDKSSTRVHLKFLLLLEDFRSCGQLCWGGAVLACLYRTLCRATKYTVTDTGACLSLLVSWAYYRIPSVRPAHFDDLFFPLAGRWGGLRLSRGDNRARLVQHRRILDFISMDGFRWTPYSDMDVMQIVPDYVQHHSMLFRAVIPLLSFEIVEYHKPDRVLR